jgi:pimeloyl-ACP methyl ester carboxylesterase
LLHIREAHPSCPTPIVFLHAIGTSGWMWERQFSDLADFHCLAPDLPGHGGSRAIRWQSFELSADLIADLIRNKFPGRRAHLVGLSLGSYVALHLLARHPGVIGRAILSGLNVLPLPGKPLIDAAAYLMAPLLKTGFGARLNAKALKIPADQFDGYRRSLQELSLGSFIAASHDATAFAIPAAITRIQTPTLLVAGAREHSMILKSLGLLHSLLPISQARLAPDAGHGWNGERPALFSAMVRSWCTAGEPPPELIPPGL